MGINNGFFKVPPQLYLPQSSSSESNGADCSPDTEEDRANGLRTTGRRSSLSFLELGGWFGGGSGPADVHEFGRLNVDFPLVVALQQGGGDGEPAVIQRQGVCKGVCVLHHARQALASSSTDSRAAGRALLQCQAICVRL